MTLRLVTARDLASGRSLQSTDCGNGHVCYDGAKCVEDQFNCDCDEASAEEMANAGLYCQHEATEFCSLDGEYIHYSFCTNGGTCLAKISPSQSHPGCNCRDGYQGSYCQYVEDIKQERFEKVTTTDSTNPTQNSSVISATGFFFIVLFFIVFTLSMALFVAIVSSKDKKTAEDQNPQVKLFYDSDEDVFDGVDFDDINFDEYGEEMEFSYAKDDSKPRPQLSTNAPTPKQISRHAII